MSDRIARALTIAGSDSGGGAGIQQDLRTFAALGVWGMTAVTAVTVQNSLGVRDVFEVPAETVAAQIEAVAGDIGVDAAKTGMLCSAATVEAVAAAVRAAGIDRLVVDPIFVSTSGRVLLDADGIQALRRHLLPLATLVTPNAAEAARLAGRDVRSRVDQREAARAIADLGPRAVLVKGGHVPGDAVDVLWDGTRVIELRASRIETPHTHGTGCVLSAAVTAGLAKGLDLETAVRRAKSTVTAAVAHALAIGSGRGPVYPQPGEPD